MSHSWDCPTDYEARGRGERDAESYHSRYSNPYRDECEEAAKQWERGFRDAEYHREQREEEERHEQQRAEQHRHEERWAEEARQEYEYAVEQERQYWAGIEELFYECGEKSEFVREQDTGINIIEAITRNEEATR